MDKGGWLRPKWLIAGALSAHLFISMPPLWLITSLGIAGLLLLAASGFRWLAFFFLASCWCLANFHVRLEDRLDSGLSGQIVTVSGEVSSIPEEGPDYLRFRFDPDARFRAQGLPHTLLVHWYRERPDLSAGQSWELELKLKPPWGRVNFQGSDQERWLFSQAIGGLGTVRSGRLLPQPADRGFTVESLRERIIDRISAQVSDPRQRGIIQALATAERSGLSANDRRLLAVTGTSHLLAISGLHIGLAAAGGFWLIRALIWFLPVIRIGALAFILAMTGGLMTALAYSALAGLGTPTVRAVLMLVFTMLAVSLPRNSHPFRAWLMAFALMLLVNPFAATGAGFWFSFLAVAALIVLFSPRTGLISRWRSLLMAQAAVGVVLLPLGAAWFNLFSPVAYLANLVAIPWVSILIVPFVLGGLPALALSETLAGALWTVAGFFSSVLLHYLEFIGHVQGPLQTMQSPSAFHLMLGLLGGFILLLPQGIRGRWGGLFLLIPLFLPPGDRTRPGELELEVLDTGQGTSILLSSGGKSLLYDSGPGDGDARNLVASVISPALARLGPAGPDRVVISHGDLDHAGGLQSLLDRYPGSQYLANLGGSHPSIAQCRAPMRWEWPGLEFIALHPSIGLPYLGNDSSCVLSVHSLPPVREEYLLLLSGDISEAIEKRLVNQNVSQHRILLVPHHGSSTSSSEEFINRVNPEVAIATAGLGNRFNFPRKEIRLRYQEQGIKFWSTAECGAIRLVLRPGLPWVASSARRREDRIWRWPASGNCP
jgi:competence protein ComEC